MRNSEPLSQSTLRRVKGSAGSLALICATTPCAPMFHVARHFSNS